MEHTKRDQQGRKRRSRKKQSPVQDPKGTETTPGEDERQQMYLPRSFDVLLGRGKSNLNHPGNKYFHGIIECNRDRYFHVTTTSDGKRAIVREIVHFMQQAGRLFLKEHRQGNNIYWTQLTEDAARQKVAHALQYRQRSAVQKSATVQSEDQSPDIAANPEHPFQYSEGGEVPSQGDTTSNYASMPSASERDTCHDDDDMRTIDSCDLTSLVQSTSLIQYPSADLSDIWQAATNAAEDDGNPTTPTPVAHEMTWEDMIRQLESPIMAETPSESGQTAPPPPLMPTFSRIVVASLPSLSVETDRGSLIDESDAVKPASSSFQHSRKPPPPAAPSSLP